MRKFQKVLNIMTKTKNMKNAQREEHDEIAEDD